jgi:predicted nuclease with TOPRIM domain
MFPPINRNVSLAKETHRKSTSSLISDINSLNVKTKAMKYAKKLWMDTKPAGDHEEIYSSCLNRISNIERHLVRLRNEYRLDTEHICDTIKTHAFHLNTLKQAIGLHELKSAQTMSDVLKIVEHTLQMQRYNEKILKMKEEAEKRSNAQRVKKMISVTELKNSEKNVVKNLKEDNIENETDEESSIDDDDDDEHEETSEDEKDNGEGEEKVKIKKKHAAKKKNEEQKVSDASNQLNFSNSLNYVITKLEAPTPYELINSDPIITPLLHKIKNKKLVITPELEDNASVLAKLFDETMSAIAEKYPSILEEVESLCFLYEKYFQSFLQNNLDELLENYEEKMKTTKKEIINRKYLLQTKNLMNSAFSYNDKIKEYSSFIHISLRNLRKLREKFDDNTTKGILINSEFSKKSQKLSYRFDCDLMPVILIIYEYDTQLNSCIELLKEWLQYDRSYSKLLLDDLKEVDKQKKNLNSVKYQCECKYNQLQFKFNALNMKIEAIGKELIESLRKKDAKMNPNDEGSGIDDVYSLNVKRVFNIKYYKYQNLDCNQLLEAIDGDLNRLEFDLTNFRATISSTKSKESIAQMKEKFEQINEMKNKLERLEYEAKHLFHEKRIKPNELDLYENCYFKLKEIHMYKNCPQTLNKIFFNLELPSIKFGLPNNSFDQLIRKPHVDRSTSPVVLGHTNTGIWKIIFLVEKSFKTLYLIFCRQLLKMH